MISFHEVIVELGGQRVLDLPDLSLEPGQVTAVIGDNGAGKTTLLLAAAGLLDLAGGSIRLGGELFHRGRAPAPQKLRQQTALVLQEPLLLARQVDAAVQFGLKARRLPRPDRGARTDEVLARLSLTRLARRSTRELSGGERRLVAFAAAVVLQPRLLLLDEVTSGLDEAAIAHVSEELERLCEAETTILMTTHQPDHLRALAHRTVILKAGRLG